jgi:hypothetical protein
MRHLVYLVFSFILVLAPISSVSATSFSYMNSALLSWTFSGIPVEVHPVVGETFFNSLCSFQSYSCTLTPQPGTGSLPGTGSITNSFDLDSDGHVFASSSLVAPGDAIIDAPFGLQVTALQPGWSTVTFNYQLQEIGTVPVGGLLLPQQVS